METAYGLRKVSYKRICPWLPVRVLYGSLAVARPLKISLQRAFSFAPRAEGGERSGLPMVPSSRISKLGKIFFDNVD